ncbi:MAG: hypothetical protein KC777_28630 [Cyanobacteria bacterium HKST-UBA02]|nr:hypothetical protein [Cyanobacteria bacterium HKST-UBA02]
MWTKELTRSEFLELLSSTERHRLSGELRDDGLLDIPKPKEESVVAIWSDSPDVKTELPCLLVVNDNELTDFLAWATTFLSSYRPVTSTFRIVPTRLLKFVKGEPSARLGELSGPFLGAVFGEALTESRSRSILEDSPISVFCSTFSYSMAKSILLYDAQFLLAELLDRWFLIRELTNQKTRSLRYQSLATIWSILSSLNVPDSLKADRDQYNVLLACNQIRETGSIGPTIWSKLTKGNLPYAFLESLSHLPMEDRVPYLIKAFEVIIQDSNALVRDFCLGYLTCMLGSSFNYADLLFPKLDFADSSLIWFGICLGLKHQSDMLNSPGGMPRRLLREIETTTRFVSRPESDLNADELMMIVNHEEKPIFPKYYNGSLRVDLLPGADMIIGWPVRRDAKSSPPPLASSQLTTQPSLTSDVRPSSDQRARDDDNLAPYVKDGFITIAAEVREGFKMLHSAISNEADDASNKSLKSRNSTRSKRKQKNK